MKIENEQIEEKQQPDEETITKQIEEGIEKKEEELEEFEEQKTELIEEDEEEQVSKYGKLKTVAYVLLLGVGVMALVKGYKNRQNNDETVTKVQRDD